MEDIVEQLALTVGLTIEAFAIALIVAGVVLALVRMPSVMFGTRSAAKRELWLDFARWLVAALTLQLAADIVHTTLSPTWDEIGRVAAIAAIRTFLTITLDRELSQMRAEESVPNQSADQPRYTKV